jgi:superfamily II DNA/RNA helicase
LWHQEKRRLPNRPRSGAAVAPKVTGMSTRFFTNRSEHTLFKKFQGVFESNPDIEFFDALIGYLRSSGYFALRPYLDKVPHIRLLVGINVDAIMADYHRRGLLFLADPTKALEEFRVWLRNDIQSAEYKRDTETGILQFVDDVISKKIELRAHPTKRLHAKLYIFRPKGFNEHKPGAVITGSSNLTAAGMGVEEQVSNYEFNILLHDFDDVQFAKAEFEQLWEESVEILPKFLTEVRDSTYLAAAVTPYELYYKLLLEYFGQSIEYDPNAITDMPEGYKRLSYQVDAVTSGFRLLEKHGGFFLADVVGLGKTMVATLIAKKFFFYNGFPDHRSHTLIVVPPAIADSWRETAKEQFRLDNCDIITNGSLHKITRPEKYDLVIVDEAHKFRNDTAEAFDELQRICKSPTQHFLPDGSRASKRVILVSATPLNNRPDDIRNLISLFQDLKDSTLSVANLQHFFARCQKEYQEAHKLRDAEQARQRVKTIYERIRTKVISEVTVRRTRNDLMEHEDYKKDLEQQAVVFPKIEPPRKVLYELPPELEDLYDRTVRVLAPDKPGEPAELTYNRFRAIGFLKPEKKRKYQNADRISAQLATIMRTLLVKRLDSSFHAFKESLRRFRDATNVMRDMFARGTIYIAPNLNVNQYLIEGREEELIAKIAERQPTDPTIEICSPSDFVDGFVEGLEADAQKVEALYSEWKEVTEDPKLDEFLRYLKDEMFDPKINRQHKLVVFSESEETTTYLLGQLAKAGFKHVLTVSSKNRAERMPIVRANFEANLPPDQKSADDYDMLISTEVLAEGVNLHRANVVVNYDTPWNSTRLMQRIGRLNRIGTTAPKIYIYNFYPTAKVDDDIELKKKAIMKLQAFHTALGEDSQIYSETEEVDNFGLFDRSPEEEERDERLALLMELRQFRKQNPEEFRRIKGLGLRARVGRADAKRAGSTVAFIRSQRRDAFYRAKPDGEIEEIALLEAADEFRAPDPNEKSIPLHAAHHDHINAALEKFKQSVVAEALQGETVDATQGPNEQRALRYLDGFSNLPFVNEDERALIQAAKTAIRRARFQNLQRQINQLQRSTKTVKVTPAALADKLMQILRTYHLQQADQSPVTAAPRALDTTPDIILSESFDNP